MNKNEQQALKTVGALALFMGAKWAFIIGLKRAAKRQLLEIENERKRTHHIQPSNAE